MDDQNLIDKTWYGDRRQTRQRKEWKPTNAGMEFAAENDGVDVCYG